MSIRKKYEQLQQEIASTIVREVFLPYLKKEKEKRNKINAYLSILPNEYNDEYYYFRLGPAIFSNKKIENYSDTYDYEEDDNYVEEPQFTELIDFDWGGDYDSNDELSTLFSNTYGRCIIGLEYRNENLEDDYIEMKIGGY